MASSRPHVPEPRNVDVKRDHGVTIEWEDGHNMGISSWEMLRALRRCPECAPDG